MMEFKLAGKILESQPYEGKIYTLVTVPSADPYSKPDTYRVRSDRPLGQTGDVVTVPVRMSGSCWHDNFTDRNTGARRSIVKTNVYFVATEAAAPAPAMTPGVTSSRASA